jgi:DNA polymerase III delta subunit
MRLYLDQFQALVKATIYPLYLLSGEDDTLLNVCQEQLYAFLTHHGFSGPVYQNDATQLFSAQLSLFSQKEIIVHKLGKSSAEFTQALTQYASTLSTSSHAQNHQKIYVLLTGKLDKSQAKSKWVQCIETHGAVVTIWPPEGVKLKRWLSDTADFFKIKLTDTQKNGILENLPNNFADIYQLLKLLHFCFADEPVTNELLHSLLCHEPQYSPQQLIETILACNLSGVIKISQHLHKHQKLLLVIWWLTQLFDWWQPALESKAGSAAYFGNSPLKTRAQSLSAPILQQIHRQLIEWKNQLFQLDIYAKNSQSLEAEYQLNHLLLSIVNTLSAKIGV